MKPTHHNAYKKFLLALAEERRSAGQTQADLASKLDRPQSYVSKVESGERRLDLVEYVYWAKAIGIDPTDFLSLLSDAVSSSMRSRASGNVRVKGKTS